MDSQVLLLNAPEGSGELGVIHTEHGDERCNRDDVEGRHEIGPETADELVEAGEARWCQYCHPPTEETHL